MISCRLIYIIYIYTITPYVCVCLCLTDAMEVRKPKSYNVSAMFFPKDTPIQLQRPL